MSSVSSSWLITGGLVLHGPPLTASVSPSDVLIENGRITAIGTGLDVPEGVERIDAAGTVVLPGFVDAHHHLWEAVVRGLTADWSLTDFLWGLRFHHTALLTPEDVFAGTLAGALTSLDAGITTVLNHHHAVNTPAHARADLDALDQVGIRTLWAFGMTDIGPEGSSFAGPDDRFAMIAALREERFSPDDPDSLLRLAIGVSDLTTVPWAQTVREYGLAKELGIWATMHSHSLRFPQQPPEIAWLQQAGLLGPRQVFSHVNAVTDEELRMLADAGGSTVTTPETELQMGMGFPAFARAASFGVASGLGTDIQANNAADPFRHMRLAMHTANAAAQEPILADAGLPALGGRPVTVRGILHHATLGGASALGIGDVVGSLEAGKSGDVVLVRVDGLHHRPLSDPLNSVVLNGRPSDVDTVLVAGRPVKRAGRPPAGTGRAAELVDASWQRLRAQMEARGGTLPTLPDGFWQQMGAAGAANLPDFIRVSGDEAARQ